MSTPSLDSKTALASSERIWDGEILPALERYIRSRRMATDRAGRQDRAGKRLPCGILHALCLGEAVGGAVIDPARGDLGWQARRGILQGVDGGLDPRHQAGRSHHVADAQARRDALGQA